ncbi:hypothetical protein GGF43_001311 [Coemansia sp. RSA 2618]|nr:hypothetical protein GGF43_001311 [Coemansia sp. RSA 2618]
MTQHQREPDSAASANNIEDASPGDGNDTAKISAQEEADLSSALIAQLLAEDSVGGNYASYYDDYGNAAAYGDVVDEYGSGSEPDDDWDPNLKRRRKSKGSGRPRKAAGRVSATGEAAESSSDSDHPKRPKKSRSAVKKTKEKPAPAPVVPGQYRTGAYTDEEEQKFNEGLELFGRSWSGISEHVVTRDPKSIRSHAQKYFIKLFRDGIPLPAKVRESGEGYTLSALQYKDPHQMVRCTPFAGQPLSKVAGSQPFRLVVHTNAQLEMDFHAHLMLSEVIGLLGGCWDAKERVLTVIRAFPCQALETDDAHTNVEMDPGSELVVRHQILDAGLCVVGWYHSHPTFRPDPSIIDIENQTAYQALFRDNDSSEEPFVGAIVGPYDPELPGPVSVFNWFYVGRSAIDRGHPKRLMVEVAPDSSLTDTEQDILLQLLDSVNGAQHHAPLEEAWRPSSTELRSLKMTVSLAHRMPWLVAPKVSPGPTTPVDVAKADAVSADSASDCTVTDANQPKDADKSDDVEKRISPVHMLAGQKATQDPFLVALCRRFTAGVFKTDASGDVANAQALACVFAAYFMQWSA